MSKKDAYWFKHDSTSGRGLRIKKIQHIYGHWGKGVYWDVIEVLREQSNYCFECDESSLQMLSEIIGCKDVEKFLSWFKDCVRLDLFVLQEKKFFSEVLCDNMANWETKKTNGSKEKKRNGSETEAKPQAKPQAKRKDKRREEKSIEEKDYLSFLAIFKDKLGKDFKSEKEMPKFLARLEDGFTIDQFKKVIENIKNDSFHKETNYKHITPEFVCRIDKLEKFLNAEPKKVYQTMTLDEKDNLFGGRAI